MEEMSNAIKLTFVTTVGLRIAMATRNKTARRHKQSFRKHITAIQLNNSYREIYCREDDDNKFEPGLITSILCI